MEFNNENVIQLHGEGLSYTQIAKLTHATRAQVSGKLRRIRAKDPSLAPRREKKIGRKKRAHQPYKPKPSVDKPAAVRKPALSRRYSIGIKPRGWLEPTKAEMRAQLAQAVRNTK